MAQAQAKAKLVGSPAQPAAAGAIVADGSDDPGTMPA
jgi:hypothetical protein